MKRTSEDKEVIKRIYMENKDAYTLHEIFDLFMSPYFVITGGQGKAGQPCDSEWIQFTQLCKKARDAAERAELEKKSEEEAAFLADSDSDEILERARKKAILMLDKIITAYSENPEKFKTIPINEITRLYSVIKSAEEQAKRTRILHNREKRETILSFLPYQRVSLSELQTLKEIFNASFERVLKLKSGESESVTATI